MVDAYANYNTASRGAPVVKDNTVGKNIVPISFLNPYSSKWTIKARITSKGEIRRWSNARGEGTLFSIDLLDAGGDEIRGTFFKDACDKFYPILEEGKVYLFSDGIVKAVQNRQYSHLISDFEITFNKQSEIIAAADDVEIKSQHFKFVKIDAIPFHDPNTTIDVIAVVKSAADVAELTSQKMGNKQLKKRDVTLIDDSGSEIKLTLWGDRAVANYDWASRPIVAFKGVKVGDYGGRSLSTTQSTGITLNPQIPEGARLNQYAMSFPNREIPAGVSLSNQAGGAGAGNADTVERRKTTSSIKDEGLGNQEKPDYITIKATTTYIKHDNDCWYTACPTPNCNKKVTETLGNNSMWRCEKCRADFPNCHYRYILSAMVSDHSGGTWVSLFNDTAEKMLGVTAEHLAMLRKEGRERDTEQIFTDALFKTYLMRLRVKSEFVNDERRVKSSVMKLDSIDFVSESRMLLEAIDRYN
jgi:replication factor A1